ncbi:MAG: alanine--tRNA ligase [Candidatus Njordarchaeales archaeon]
MSISKEELFKLFGKEEYETEFFKEMGFVRKQCKVCGRFFWTLNPDRETCGDVECEGEYRFIEDNTWSREWDIHNTIRKWTGFFAERGHAVLDPYPVVARWRDDIEFTIASIAVFQPWVVKGIVDPPANPLVIPQPCLRFGGEFSDIDNIGKTGRHLTSFTMGGQHAFNSEKSWIYWKDEYLRYNFEFMTKVLEIPSEELTYKEDVWSGGGNFGPSIETFAYGLEIVNGVFMQYEFIDSRWAPLKLKVLDVGWGLERIAWFRQRTPTIYEATFGPVFEWLKNQIGLEIDKELLVKYAKLSGILDTKSPERFKKSREKIASLLGFSLKELEDKLAPIEAVYAILDHTKTLVFAIPDGGIPSNVGGAYNLRMILRRAVSLAENMNFQIDWEELLHKQIDYFSESFPRIEEGRDVVVDVWKVELQRYKSSLEKGIAELLRLIKKKKLKVIRYEILRDLYINHGLPPSSVEEIAKKQGVKVEIPPNFFDLIRLEKQAKSGEERKEDLEETIRRSLGKVLEGLPSTKPLYYEDQYMKEFDAKIVFVKNHYVVLDQTAFYPRGGGQLEDTGEIIIDGKILKVVDVRKIGNVIVHVVDSPVERELVGKTIHGKINWRRRWLHMKHHTATHIVNAAARYVLGPHVWQVGAEKSEKYARLDISHHKNLTEEEINRIEELANKIVMENRPVKIEILDRTTAEKKYGVRIYQGGAVPGKYLRIVSVKDWEVEACGGTHVRSTGEIGFIKIIGTRRIHDGVVRLIFVAGERAYEYIKEQEKYLKESCEILKVVPGDLPKTVKRFFEEWKDQQEHITKLSNLILNHLETIIEKEGKKLPGDVLLVRIDFPHNLMIEVLKRLNNLHRDIILASTVGGKTTIVAAGSKNFLEKLKEIIEKIGAKGRIIKFGLIASSEIDASTILTKLERVMQ